MPILDVVILLVLLALGGVIVSKVVRILLLKHLKTLNEAKGKENYLLYTSVDRCVRCDQIVDPHQDLFVMCSWWHPECYERSVGVSSFKRED